MRHRESYHGTMYWNRVGGCTAVRGWNIEILPGSSWKEWGELFLPVLGVRMERVGEVRNLEGKSVLPRRGGFSIPGLEKGAPRFSFFR